MAVYEKLPGDTVMQLKEHHLYGNRRLGIWEREQNIDLPKLKVANANSLGPTYGINFDRGNKFFELTNHLGNTLAVISDKKSGHDVGNGTIDYYNAEVVFANDYFPFGMRMPGRRFLPLRDTDMDLMAKKMMMM